MQEADKNRRIITDVNIAMLPSLLDSLACDSHFVSSLNAPLEDSKGLT